MTIPRLDTSLTAADGSNHPNPYAGPTAEGTENPQDSSDSAIRMLIPIDRSGWAIAAGYLGLFSLLCFPGPLAVIAGVLAIRDIKANPRKHGLGRAWFGIILGTLGTLMLAFMVISLGF